MKTIIFLCIIIGIYYQIYKRYPERLTNRTHLYFVTFVVSVSLLYYFMNYQKIFIYKLMTNVKNADEKPLYDVDSVVYKENQMNGLKYNLAMRQGWRCLHCQNPLLQKDIFSHDIHYIKPLQFGGKNDVTNLGLKCSTCSTFSPY